MTRLTDLQLILLSTAAQRETGSLLPPAPTVTAQGDRIRKALAQLLKRGLVEEALVSTADEAWRQDDETAYGVVINAAGRAAIAIDAEPGDSQDLPPADGDARLENMSIGIDEDAGSADAAQLPSQSSADAGASPLSSPIRSNKTADVLALLRRAEGATLDEMVAATGWLPHTTRAALTGLRKKGHAIERGKRGEISCYSLKTEVAV